jgi:hypothetical protein
VCRFAGKTRRMGKGHGAYPGPRTATATATQPLRPRSHASARMMVIRSSSMPFGAALSKVDGYLPTRASGLVKSGRDRS